MNKEQLFEQIDEIYSEWHGGELHIGTERTERIKEVFNQAINFIPCCETFPNSEEPISLIIKQIKENVNRLIEEVKQVNKFAVNKKTVEEITKLNRLR